MSDIWGQDIALDASGQARVAANGELVLTEGVETGVQDVRIRLSTYLGTLFYDKTPKTPATEIIAKTSERGSLYEALDVASIWLSKNN